MINWQDNLSIQDNKNNTLIDNSCYEFTIWFNLGKMDRASEHKPNAEAIIHITFDEEPYGNLMMLQLMRPQEKNPQYFGVALQEKI